MKKLFSLFVPLMALFLTLAPQTAKGLNYIKITRTGTQSCWAEVTLIGSWNATDVANLNLEKSTNGSTWNAVKTCTSSNGKYYADNVPLTSNGQYVCFRMSPNSTILKELGKTKYFQIATRAQSTATMKVEGNIMSLLYGNECADKFVIPKNYCFYRLFTVNSSKQGDSSSGCPTSVDYSGVELPATTLTKACYADMFVEVNTRMAKAPTVLPALELADSCYAGMFKNCATQSTATTWFTIAPTIKAKTLKACNGEAISCCREMFYGCTMLHDITVEFDEWGNTVGEENPTYNWLYDVGTNYTNYNTDYSKKTREARNFNCPENLSTGTRDANHIPTNGSSYSWTINNNLIPQAYVFDLNEGTRDAEGTCAADYYYANSVASLPDAYKAGKTFAGWFTAAEGGTQITASDVSSAPSTLKTYFAHYEDAATKYQVSVTAPTNGTITVTYNDGSESFTSGSRNISDGTPLTITAEPVNGNYILTGLTVTPAEESSINHTSGNVYLLDGKDITIAATFARAYTITASGEHGTVTGTGKFAVNSNINLTAVPDDFYAFVRWSNGSTTNPLPIAVSEDVNLTAIFEVDPQSDPESVDVYQVGTGAGATKILYDLSPTTDVNNSEIVYTPKDMGYGVAWADRNIGATSTTDAGGFFYWGGLTAIPSTNWPNTAYYEDIDEITNRTLPLEADAAYHTMGGNTWRVPTKAEWEALLNASNTNLSDNITASSNSDRKGNGTITNKYNADNKIILPQTGVVRVNESSIQMGEHRSYWSASLIGNPSGTSSCPYILYTYVNKQTLEDMNFKDPVTCRWLMPIRAIYSPRFSQNTLTIRTINGGTTYTYIYICEYGQEVTVTANANTGANYVFNEWNDHTGGATRTFTVTADATYTATFTQATTYSITFVDEDGETVLDGPKDVVEGVVPTYNGETPTKAATAQYTYTFNDWYPALYAADKAQTYTATYSPTPQSYTLTWVTDGDALTGTYTSGSTAYGTTIVRPNTPTKANHVFAGWDAGNDGVADEVAETMPAANTTYTAVWTLNLPDNTDNSSLLTLYNGQTANVAIGRTFYADGNWGTVCLPFNLSIAGTAFDGAEVRTMSNAYIYDKGGENEKLIIECDESTSTTTLTAGRPYIIRFAEGDNIVNPTFNGVTISVTSAGNVEGTDLNFNGLLAPQALATDGSNLFLGGNNTLYKPSPSSATVNAFRAYFAYKGVQQYPRRSMMVFDKGAQMPTDVEIVTPEDKPLDGKRIENGQLVIYRNGMRYNVAGQLLD